MRRNSDRDRHHQIVRHRNGRAFPDLLPARIGMNDVQKQALRDSWTVELRKAIEADRWGQMIEAVEGYEILQQVIEVACDKIPLNGTEQQLLKSTVSTLERRIRELSGVDLMSCNTSDGNESESTVQVLGSILTVLNKLFVDDSLSVALTKELSQQLVNSRKRDDNEQFGEVECKEESSESDQEEDLKGTLLPRAQNMSAGSTRIRIEIEKIGLKDIHRYLEPTIRISVVAKWGEVLGKVQETAVATVRGEKHIWFNANVHVQLSKEEIQEQHAAVFIEFLHWKPAKSKMSTRCWTVLECDELIPGKKLLQIYAKPACYTRDEFFLHSVKKLYCHVEVHTTVVRNPVADKTNNKGSTVVANVATIETDTTSVCDRETKHEIDRDGTEASDEEDEQIHKTFKRPTYKGYEGDLTETEFV